MRKSETQKSRRKTPWDCESNLTPTQTFLKENYEARYNVHHRKVGESGEAELVNYYAPSKCPFCGCEKFKKNGYTDSGVQRYRCAHVKRIFCQQQEPFLMSTNYQSANGWSTASTCFDMLALLQTRGITRTHLQRPDTGYKNSF